MRLKAPLIALALCAAALPAWAEEPAAFAEAKIAAGKAMFESGCHRCHAPNAKDPSYGPALTGIVGRQAGSFEGYEYSEALGGAPFVWTPAALKAWMEDNQHFLPGTKMRHVGITDTAVQDFIIAYLRTL